MYMIIKKCKGYLQRMAALCKVMLSLRMAVFDSVLERTADTDAATDSAPQEIIDASGLIRYRVLWIFIFRMQGS